MKPAPFEYEAPASLDAALELLARHGGDAKILAGGQSLIPVMNFRLTEPALLVDINRLAELDFIRADEDGTLRIGALARQRRPEHAPLVAARAALLHEELTAAALDAAAETAARHEMEPRSDVHATTEFKRHLARVLTRRALRLAADRARSGEDFS